MPITIKFASFLREITQENEIFLDLREISMAQLIELLCEKYGKQFEEKCLKENKKDLKSFINIFLNKTPILDANVDSIRIRDNDIIHLLPAISGGSYLPH